MGLQEPVTPVPCRRRCHIHSPCGHWAPAWLGAGLPESDPVWAGLGRLLRPSPLWAPPLEEPGQCWLRPGVGRDQAQMLSVAGLLPEVPEVGFVQRPAGGGRGAPGDQATVSQVVPREAGGMPGVAPCAQAPSSPQGVPVHAEAAPFQPQPCSPSCLCLQGALGW